MAHELSKNANGEWEAMFAGKKPWHGLGTMIQTRQTPISALELAHLNWKVKKIPLWLFNSDGSRTQVDDKVATIREDSGKYLGTVGTDWTPVQNIEQAEFVEALLGEGEAVVECLGALRDGRRIFWTCKVGRNLKVADGDEIEKYLILCNGHDGSLAFRAFWSPIRVVCANTLNVAIQGCVDGVVLYHTLNVNNRVTQARNILGLTEEYYTKIGHVFAKMMKKEIGDVGFKSYLDCVFPLGTEEKPTGHATDVARDQVTKNFYSGRGHEVAGKTAWGAYNAVTEFVCHQRQQKGATENNRPEKRFESILFGSGKTLQQKAYNVAVEMAGVK